MEINYILEVIVIDLIICNDCEASLCFFCLVLHYCCLAFINGMVIITFIFTVAAVAEKKS